MGDLHYETLQHIPNDTNESLPLFSLHLIIAGCRIDDKIKYSWKTPNNNRHFLFKMNQNKIIYTWIFFSSCDIWVTTWCKSRGWNNISRGNENKTLLSCYVETQFINQFILFICTLSPEPLHLTASSDTECFNLTRTKGPRPKLYQNVILPHINLVNSKSARRQQKTLTPQ